MIARYGNRRGIREEAKRWALGEGKKQTKGKESCKCKIMIKEITVKAVGGAKRTDIERNHSGEQKYLLKKL